MGSSRALRLKLRRIRNRLLSAGALIASAAPLAAKAQELDPRAYTPSPVGANLAIVSYGVSEGGVLFDATSPISNAHAKFNAAALGLGHVFDLWGRQASVLVVAPYAWGSGSGDFRGVSDSISREGAGDLRLRLGAILLGSPALTPEEFAVRKQHTTLAASLLFTAPTGQYDSTRLINIGTNRWALKPEIGLTVPHGPWQLDTYAAVIFFQDNNDFFHGHVRQQAPITSVQGHVSYTFKPRLWVAFDAIYYTGGSTTVDGVHNDDRQDNARLGVTLSVPVGKQSLKFTYSDGAVTRIGGKYTEFGVAWQYAWLSP